MLWVARMAASGGWRPLSGLVCTMAISVGQGNLILYFQGKFRKKLREFLNPILR